MRIEHLNLVVNNIETSLDFYQAAFPHWVVRSKGTSDWYGVTRNWLHFGDDYNYLTFNDNGIKQNRNLKGHQIGLAHFAFETSNIERLISRLASAGFPVAKQGAKDRFRKNIYFIDPNGFEVEFVECFSDVPSERNEDTV
jgi:catechol 2,3-dioxygenase-like lactoylglutathione lyase family enzyme